MQKYAGWQCFNERREPVFADVAAFAREDDDLGLEDNLTIPGEQGRRVHLVRRPLDVVQLQDFDAAFVSPRVHERFQHHCPRGYPLNAHTDSDLPEILQGIEAIAAEHSYENVVMTGRGYEDEGEFFQQWVNQAAWPLRLEVRTEHELDLADLRGFRAGAT